MLKLISWAKFWIALLVVYGLYYTTLLLLFFWKVILKSLRRKAGMTVLCLACCGALFAQDGNTGLTQANTLLRGYYDTATQILYAVGGLVGLIGAGVVFAHWNDRNHQVGKEAAMWFGGCIFLILVATVIKSFFGL